MSLSGRQRLCSALAGAAFLLAVAVTTAPAQIDTGIIEKYRAELQKQANDPATKRDRTLPEDWVFTMAEGVTSRQITFYSDGAPCYGRREASGARIP